MPQVPFLGSEVPTQGIPAPPPAGVQYDARAALNAHTAIVFFFFFMN